MSALLVLLMAASVSARTLRVPSEYRTIQSALSAISRNDTVLVAIGTYAEALYAPSCPFTIKGDVAPDTGDYPRPILDPAGLPGCDSLCCLTLPGGSAPVIEDIHFRNGAGMYPRHNWGIGGIKAAFSRATFQRCIFDSLYWGLSMSEPCSLQLDQSRFVNCYNPVLSDTATFVHATDCLFASRGWAQLYVSGSAIIERCQFGDNDDGPQCEVDHDVQIRDCQFGPSIPGGPQASYEIVQLYEPNGVIENNVFTGLRLGRALMTAACSCTDSDRVRIVHNSILNCYVDSTIQNGSSEIYFACQNYYVSPCGAEIDSNVFNNIAAHHAPCRGIDFDRGADGTAICNHFRQLTSQPLQGYSGVFRIGHTSWLNLHDNRFFSTGVAFVDNRDGNLGPLDLRGNWWSAPSGPYHAIQNPTGQGDTIISNYVDFSGWCLDTACTRMGAKESRIKPLPTAFTLTAFPNPFNNETAIRFEAPEPQIVRIELFDILGRRVKELWAGAIADEKEIRLDGSEMASGIYFVRVTDTIYHRLLASTKVVLLK